MAVDQPRCATCLIFASGRSRRRDLSLDLARQACCLCVSHLTAFSRLGGQALRTHAVRQRASQGLRRRRRSGPASSPLAGRRISAASVLISSAIGGSAAGIARFWRVFGRFSLPVGTPQIGGLLRQSYSSSFWRQGSLLAGSPQRVEGSTTRAGEKPAPVHSYARRLGSTARCPAVPGSWLARSRRAGVGAVAGLRATVALAWCAFAGARERGRRKTGLGKR